MLSHAGGDLFDLSETFIEIPTSINFIDNTMNSHSGNGCNGPESMLFMICYQLEMESADERPENF